MNTDIRVDIRLPRHWKYRKLKRIVGGSLMEHLVMFWGTVAEQIPNGVLNGWSNEDIEEAAGWDGEPGVFVSAMIECGFLDQTEDGFYPHDWHEHQPWVVGGKERSELAKKAGKASAAARKEKYGTSQPSNVTPNETATDSERPVRTFDRTPSPSPSPSPSPLKDQERGTLAIDLSEAQIKTLVAKHRECCGLGSIPPTSSYRRWIAEGKTVEEIITTYEKVSGYPITARQKLLIDFIDNPKKQREELSLDNNEFWKDLKGVKA